MGILIKDFYKEHKETVDRLGFTVFFVLFFYLFVNYIFAYIAPFFFGYIISLLFEPLVALLSRKWKLNRGLLAFFCIIVLIFLVGGIGTNLVMKIIFEARSFQANIPGMLQDISRITDGLVSKFNHYFMLVPDTFQTFVTNSGKALIDGLTGMLSSGVKKGSVNIVAFIPGMLMGLLLTLISSFFFIKDKQLINDTAARYTPKWVAEKIGAVKRGFTGALGGYVKTQIILMSINSIIIITGLLILRYPYALFVGLAIAIVDMLPVFGAGTILWPWAIYSFIVGNYVQGVGLFAIYGVVLITRQSVEPRVLGQQIGIHPLITLMAMYIGLQVFGALGFLIGPMLAVAIKSIFSQEHAVAVK